MNKSQIIDHIASNTDFNKKDSAQAVKAVLMAITEGLRDDGKVRILGFGGFAVNDTKARLGRNPKTGEIINIEAKKKISFSPGDELKKKM
jgi:DNA-binding protein HU-beta